MLAAVDDNGRTENAGVERRSGMTCRELAKKKSVNPRWMTRMLEWVTETLAKPEPYSAHFIFPPEKHQKTGNKLKTEG